ncbi:MAG: hypothetical protein KDC93_08365 [Cyclobacteriaceae bacterium]|jgi:signal transduction histidine kinase|nr:hypothetical protein [Cyclobacteriaceae bacterium]
MLILAIVVLIFIAIFLLSINAIPLFWICAAEIVVFFALLVLHVKGHFALSRYIFFAFSIVMEVFGSLVSGENGGFDFLFFVTALSPLLFFDKRWQYLSLFIFSISCFIAVKILYQYVPSMLDLERQLFPYYFNIAASAALIYFGYGLFKKEHLKHEMDLNKQKEMVQNQKEVLLATKNQLEILLEARTRKLEEKNQGISKYAYLNSHKVRSPLARILGLVNLTQYEDLNEDETRSYYFNELKTNATDLDNVLKEISEILNSDLEK